MSVDKEVVQKYVTLLSMMSKHHEPIAESLDFLQEMIKSNCNGGGELYTQTSKIIEDIMERLKYSNTLGECDDINDQISILIPWRRSPTSFT